MSTDQTSTATGYALWAVFGRTGQHHVDGDLERRLQEVAQEVPEVVLRGVYDVSGLRAEADLLVWFTGPDAAELQRALRALRRVEPFSSLMPCWNALGVYREAEELGAQDGPTFLNGREPGRWLTVYPFVRSHEWYLLAPQERRTMLAERAESAAAFPGVFTSTLANFALGDYEWLIALEADDPLELVDLIRRLRGTAARHHVREEMPFFTGRRLGPHEIGEVVS